MRMELLIRYGGRFLWGGADVKYLWDSLYVYGGIGGVLTYTGFNFWPLDIK